MNVLVAAAKAVIANASRPGERACLDAGPNGEDIWIAHQEVHQSVLDALSQAIDETERKISRNC